MTEDFNYITSRGLPGGPNQEITYVTGVVSVEGYRYDSPDKNNSVNLIESGDISMSENDGTPLRKGPLLGMDNLGNKEIMMPGTNYSFPGDQVLEIPMAQRGFFTRRKPKIKEQTPEEEYYNPELEKNITTGDWRQDFLYNNQWLMNTPILGDYIKDKARKIAEMSAGERRDAHDLKILENPDSMYNLNKDEVPNYTGWSSIRDNEENKDKVSLMDQYFSEEALLPVSSYKPKSDYLEFLPSYSIKAASSDGYIVGDQGYKNRRDCLLYTSDAADE